MSKDTLLIAEDTPSNIQVLHEILHDEYELKVANNGQTVLDIIKNTGLPDLILMDIMMPVMDGIECAGILKESPETADIPILFLTALSEEDQLVRAFNAGGADYITKPFRIHELKMRIRTHLEISKARKAVQTAHERQSELLHILCHDLANPFASIISALSVIREDAGVLDELLPAVEDSAERGMDIISMVKKHRSLKLKGIILEEIDLKSAWDEACRGIIHMAEAKNISLVPLEGSEKYQILAEEVSLVNTVLVNILSNALKFSSGGSSVRGETESSGDRVILSIIDEGIGIPEEILSRLFDAHARDTHRRGTDGETGTGFGMPLVKSMMEYYGGDIQVTSTPGEGTRVSLRFRRA